jgi:TPP-dependent pyruvate/acetoin dehydrogenase alpha subunit
MDNPILRLRNYMERKGWWSEEQDKALIETVPLHPFALCLCLHPIAESVQTRQEVLAALKRAEERPKPPVRARYSSCVLLLFGTE